MMSFRTLPALVAAIACTGCMGAFQPRPAPRVSVTPVSAPEPVRIAPGSVLDAPALVPLPAPLAPHELAYQEIGRSVFQQSHPRALQLAFQAYYNYRAAHPEKVRNPYLYYVDYGLDSRDPRGYVFDMDALTIVEGPFTVAHGRGSTNEMLGIPTRFTNIEDSATTSLGLYLAEETYNFQGTSNGQRYRSIGLRLTGLSGQFNSAARRRGIVVHGAPYVTAEKAGRSEGCPAMEPERAERLIPLIANGGLVFLFSPQDARWMRNEPWIDHLRDRLASSGGLRLAP